MADSLLTPKVSQMGRPLKFKSVPALRKKIQAYFDNCDPHWIDVEVWVHPYKELEESLESQPQGGALKRTRSKDYTAPMVIEKRKQLTDQKPYTITGLALALGTSRETLLEYEERPDFVDTIKDAKLKCQYFTEQYLYTGKNATGAIFSLKNNYGWVDKSEVDNKHELVQPILGNVSKRVDADVHSDDSDT